MMMAVPGATWSRKLTELLEYPVVERPVWELLCVGSVIAGVVVCLLGRPDVAVVPLTVIIVVALGMLAHGDRLWTALRPGWAGTALLIVIGTETIGVFASTYRHNSIQFVISLYLLSVMYFLARNTCHRVEYRRFYHMAMSLLGTALAVVFVWNALTRTPDLRSIGLENLARFKNLIPPVAGGAVAETVTILLSLLPFTIVLLWISGDLKLLWAASAVTSVVAILLTLSRGGYIALVAFVVISTAYLCVRAGQRRRRQRVLLTLAGLLLVSTTIISLTPVAEAVLRTFRIVDSASHARSIDGRFRLWERVGEMIRSRPLFGVGASNFALANVAFSDQSDAVPFAAQPFNVVLEVLVERGVIGAIGYLWFVLSFFAVSIQAVRRSPDRVTKDTAAVLAIGFFAVLVRDGTYSSMISNAGVSAVVVFLIAHNSSLLNQSSSSQVATPRACESERSELE